MLSHDFTLFTLGWDNHGELGHEDRQALLTLLTEGQTRNAPPPEPERVHQHAGSGPSPAANQAPPAQAPRKACPAGAFPED